MTVEEPGLWSRRGAAHVSCAHRGFSARFPENTVPAIEAAIPHADYVEIDVRTSSDGSVVVLHDATPERTTDVADRWPRRRTDPIDTFELHEIQRLDAGSWFGADTPPAAVPVLQEVLEIVDGTPCGVLVEVKGSDPSVIVDLVTDFRRGHSGAHIALGSVKPDVARGLAETVTAVPVGVLFVDQTHLTAAQLGDYATFASFLGFRNDHLTDETVARVHAAGLLAMHNTNTRAAIEAAIAAGADATMSDDPSIVGDIVNGRGALVIEAEHLAGPVPGTAPVQRAELSVPYKLSGGAAALVTNDSTVIPLGQLPTGQLVCRIATGPRGGRFTVALDGLPAVEVDSSSRSPARRQVAVADVIGSGEHRLVITRLRSGDDRGAAELIIDTIEVRTADRA